jgi:biopolymer transport protein ExbB
MYFAIMGFFEESDWYLHSGNLIVLLIFGCSLISLTVFIERLIHIKKAESDNDELLLSLRRHIEEGNHTEAIRCCADIGGAVARILSSGLARHKQSRDRIENSMQIKGMSEIAALEKNAKVLSIIATLCPLLGLLGTVMGFIHAFAEMRQSGLTDISTGRIGEALEYALITTAAGLVVAIPTIIAYNYIISRIQSLVLEMQITSSEIVDLIEHHKDDAF